MPFEAALDVAVQSLADADRRLTHEIAAGVLRSRASLDQELASRIDRRWERVDPDLRDVLRIGAYQLFRLERIPPHAAVNSAVELAKAVRGPAVGGFVNAILRRIVREGHGRSPDVPGIVAGTGKRRPAEDVRASHPAWLVARWVRQFGEDRTEALLARNNRRPATFLRPARWTIDRLRAAFDDAGVPYTEREDIAGLALRGGRVSALPGYDEGAFIVQDPAQAMVGEYAGVAPGARVWDACAAPGGKAAALSARATVIATDLNRKRMERLRETVRRAAPSILLATADGTAPPFRDATFDTVLLDAPCSATGTIARHPDARWRIEPATITRLAAEQARLLLGVAGSVRPGGFLIYTTCSLEPEENQLQVDQFLAGRADFRRDRPDLFIFPPDADTDGAFAARLERNP